MYKILPSQQGPVILTDQDEVIFLFQYAHLMELYYEDEDIGVEKRELQREPQTPAI